MNHGLSGMSAAARIARLTMKRLLRSRLMWVSGVLAITPIVALAAIGGGMSMQHKWRELFSLLAMILAIIPVVHLAPVIAEEFEDRTYTYLWSRPFPRWAVLAGKLMALVPVAAAQVGTSIALAFVLAFGGDAGANLSVLGQGLIAGLMGVGAMGATAVGIGSLLPRFATAVSLVYLLAIDASVGFMPFALKNLSVSYHVRQIALHGTGSWDALGSPWVSAVWLAGITGVWLGVAVWRISVAEYAMDR